MEWSTDTKGQNLAHDGTVVQPPPAERQAIASADRKVADRLDIARVLQEFPVGLFPGVDRPFQQRSPVKTGGTVSDHHRKDHPG